MIVEIAEDPTSPPFKGTRDRVAKVTEASVGADMIVLFSLAMVGIEGKEKSEINSNPH